MRLFTAIDIPADVKETLRSLLNRLRPTAKLQWSPVDNLHVTTKFIGEWPEDRVGEIKTALAQVSAPVPMWIHVHGLGWFPNAAHPWVFWAGIESGDGLSGLAQATEDALAKIGVPHEDRAYSPHLTLARIRDRSDLAALHQAIESTKSTDFGAFQPAEFVLYLSAGGRYKKLAAFPLR